MKQKKVSPIRDIELPGGIKGKIDFSDLMKTLKDLEKRADAGIKKQDVTPLTPLLARMMWYLKNKEVGQAIISACDLIIRLRMGQLTSVARTLQEYCTLHQEGKGVDINEPLYKGIELGELIDCYSKNPNCEYAKDCWITRKGFAECRKGNKGK